MWSPWPSAMSSPAAPDIVYFDLETQRSAGDVGGWGNKDRMGMSIGVTYSTKLAEYRIYREKDADELVSQLLRADLVVGFNHIDFDYRVLQAYTILDLAAQTVNLDLLVSIEAALGRRIKLEDVAMATLGVGKTAEGMQAITWFREGKWLDIARYCAYDVKVTMRVHEYGRKFGHVKYLDPTGQEQKLPVDW
jgi:RNase_H superfamily